MRAGTAKSGAGMPGRAAELWALGTLRTTRLRRARSGPRAALSRAAVSWSLPSPAMARSTCACFDGAELFRDGGNMGSSSTTSATGPPRLPNMLESTASAGACLTESRSKMEGSPSTGCAAASRLEQASSPATVGLRSSTRTPHPMAASHRASLPRPPVQSSTRSCLPSRRPTARASADALPIRSDSRTASAGSSHDRSSDGRCSAETAPSPPPPVVGDAAWSHAAAPLDPATPAPGPWSNIVSRVRVVASSSSRSCGSSDRLASALRSSSS
mmetsp:Transcript_21843/g.83139  ORF Transcript_21843/g.83139 Transcript_21843/m.83139 type:complete len:272 (+) Transcript_21843:125-940(+)